MYQNMDEFLLLPLIMFVLMGKKNRMPRKQFWLLVSMTIQPTTHKTGGTGIGT